MAINSLRTLLYAKIEYFPTDHTYHSRYRAFTIGSSGTSHFWHLYMDHAAKNEENNG